MNLLNAFASQLSLALERAHSAETAEQAKLESEKILLRNTMLASISHDLRTPLSAIAGAGSLIALPGYSLCADRRKLLGELIERKAQDMSALLSNILKLTEMEFGGGTRRMEWHSLDDLVEHSLRVNQARLANHRVHVNLPSDLPLICVEATLVVQILNNLLDNAAKYTPPETRVEIRAATESGGILIEISDDGPGLPPGDPARLFAKFQRGRTESDVAGVGLGLAICKAAAALHGGDIRAMNGPAGGARFEVRLPVKMYAEIVDQDAVNDLEASA
jgi:two-component system sensor histidine kinase KdpD